MTTKRQVRKEDKNCFAYMLVLATKSKCNLLRYVTFVGKTINLKKKKLGAREIV